MEKIKNFLIKLFKKLTSNTASEAISNKPVIDEKPVVDPIVEPTTAPIVDEPLIEETISTSIPSVTIKFKEIDNTIIPEQSKSIKKSVDKKSPTKKVPAKKATTKKIVKKTNRKK